MQQQGHHSHNKNTNSNSTIGITLVTGATGSQGSAVVKYLLQHGHVVRAVTRDPQKTSELTTFREQYSGQLEIVKASYEDAASLEAALKGVTGVFSVQQPNFADGTIEETNGTTLVKLAKQAGVRTFVQTTVSRSGEHESFPRWNEGYWSREYWLPKGAIEEAVKTAGFENYTIIKPTVFTKDFLQPMVNIFFPNLNKGEIAMPISPDTKIHTIDTDDVGKFAAAVFENPERFNKKLINLSSEPLTLREIAEVLSKASGTSIKVEQVTPEEAIRRGLSPVMARVWEWVGAVGYKKDDVEKQYGFSLVSFEEWAEKNFKLN